MQKQKNKAFWYDEKGALRKKKSYSFPGISGYSSYFVIRKKKHDNSTR